MGARTAVWIVGMAWPVLAPALVYAATCEPDYHLEPRKAGAPVVQQTFTAEQVGILEKLNRADANHLNRLPELVIPQNWTCGENAYSPLPQEVAEWSGDPKRMVVNLEAQAFGAYEHGKLVRWGPVSTGRKAAPTPAGSFHLNWKAPVHYSTSNPDWRMPWYFNFDNRDGFAMHAYSMPGLPESHGCIRMLPRDAKWLFTWGEGWELSANGWVILRQGTPLEVTGQYPFGNPPPWRSLAWLEHGTEAPAGSKITAAGAR